MYIGILDSPHNTLRLRASAPQDPAGRVPALPAQLPKAASNPQPNKRFVVLPRLPHALPKASCSAEALEQDDHAEAQAVAPSWEMVAKDLARLLRLFARFWLKDPRVDLITSAAFWEQSLSSSVVAQSP